MRIALAAAHPQTLSRRQLIENMTRTGKRLITLALNQYQSPFAPGGQLLRQGLPRVAGH